MEKSILPADRKREIIIRAEEETDFNYGCKPEDRQPLSHYINNGIINLDKPSGPTSHEIATWVKKILKVKKSGHGGTLDPKVTGILPVALGNATKVNTGLLNAGKEYVCLMKIHHKFDFSRIRGVLNLFTNNIYQIPPLKSAVARVLRTRRIYYIKLLEFEKDENLVLFKVGCEAGTYIRKLCYDIGEVLLVGASMVELRRTRVGLFKEDSTLCTLQDLNDAMYLYEKEGEEYYLKKFIQPMETAIEHMDKIIIRDTAVDSICHGADLAVNGVLNLNASIEKGDIVAIMTQKGELVAFATTFRSARKIATLKSGLIAKTDRVFMKRKTYPFFKKKD
ncbi:MAG: RNA-guided pseudouridylation complex pseudouridine synthase subunit Cbf5 [Candidatus Lokiarchaeota archaeon]|nr:RNA-guided pseudouridylation complex pseudouridine synthase subunit Cbf5 [Candidatus Lokiarchaeota archaeon]